MDLTAKKLVFFKLGTARNLNLSFPDEKRVSSPVTTSWSLQITTSSHFAILYHFRLKIGAFFSPEGNSDFFHQQKEVLFVLVYTQAEVDGH